MSKLGVLAHGKVANLFLISPQNPADSHSPNDRVCGARRPHV